MFRIRRNTALKKSDRSLVSFFHIHRHAGLEFHGEFISKKVTFSIRRQTSVSSYSAMAVCCYRRNACRICLFIIQKSHYDVCFESKHEGTSCLFNIHSHYIITFDGSKFDRSRLFSK